MRTFMLAFLATLCWVYWLDAESTTPRGSAAPAAFRKANPCPSTGKTSGACPGYVIDHLHSLRCGGLDVPENLWWQTVAEAKLKDTQEDECWRYYKSGVQPPANLILKVQ